MFVKITQLSIIGLFAIEGSHSHRQHTDTTYGPNQTNKLSYLSISRY